MSVGRMEYLVIEDSDPPGSFAAEEIIFAEMKLNAFSLSHLFTNEYGPIKAKDATEATCIEKAIDFANGGKPDYVSGPNSAGSPLSLVRTLKLILKPETTPFDVVPKNKCWLIIRLDGNRGGWQFAPGHLPITVKPEGVLSGDNVDLRHVYPTKPPIPLPSGVQQVSSGVVSAGGCKVAYFGIAARRDQVGQRFNFHTKFVQKNSKPGKPDHDMVVIFDPDIPDDGHDEIPPP